MDGLRGFQLDCPDVQCMYGMKKSVMSSTVGPRSKRINVRASAKEAELMRRGAAQRNLTLTDFIVKSACMEAEETLADQRVFTLPPDRWAAFMNALDHPPRVHPRLQELFEQPTTLGKKG